MRARRFIVRMGFAAALRDALRIIGTLSQGGTFVRHGELRFYPGLFSCAPYGRLFGFYVFGFLGCWGTNYWQ